MKRNLLVIMGPTASGKTRLAIQVAHRMGGEIISGDSRQVYKGLDIGTGKEVDAYGKVSPHVPYHLIDVVEAGTPYHVAQYQEDFAKAFDKVRAHGKLPILCGGSGLYIQAALHQFAYTHVPRNDALRDELATKSEEELLQLFHRYPSSYSTLADLSTRKRVLRAIEIGMYLNEHTFVAPNTPALVPLVVALQSALETRRQRIEARLHQRLAEGLVAEVEGLLETIATETLIQYGLEYKFVTQYVQGEMSYETMVERLTIAIQQFAKRQMTFFRHMERDGLRIHWLDSERELDDLVTQIEELWNQ